MKLSPEFATRRKKLLASMAEDSIAIIPSAHECLRNGDAHYSFRQNSDFFYLTGFTEPEAVIVLVPGRQNGEFILFNRERDPEREIWDGNRAGQEGAKSIYGADQSYSISQLEEVLPQLMSNHKRVYIPMAKDMAFTRKINQWINRLQTKIRSGVTAPTEILNIETIIHEMRIIKSDYEIELMRKAGQISAHAHLRAMQNCRPGMYEYELEAIIQAEYLRNGSRSPAYNHIIGAGENSCVLHYIDNNQIIKDGDLVLIDSGAEYNHYAADITRTFPANGRFSKEQKAIYEVVLAAQMAVLAIAKPGSSWNDLHTASTKAITQGLLDLGLLKGKFEELHEKQAYMPFYMHRVSHWLGIDVHDVGAYMIDGQWRKLQPGMVITIEPGIYIPANSPHADSKWWNIGVRIEDDVLITANGHEVLTSAVPKTVAEIEAIMQNAKETATA
jgi:Xaa-Pro aminopeptidase